MTQRAVERFCERDVWWDPAPAAPLPAPDHVIAALGAAARASHIMDDPQEAEALRVLVVRARQQWDATRKAAAAPMPEPAAAAPHGGLPDAEATLREAKAALVNTWAGDPHAHGSGVVLACQQYAEAERRLAAETGDTFDTEDYVFEDAVQTLAVWYRESEDLRSEAFVGLTFDEMQERPGPLGDFVRDIVRPALATPPASPPALLECGRELEAGSICTRPRGHGVPCRGRSKAGLLVETFDAASPPKGAEPCVSADADERVLVMNTKKG